MFRNKNGPEEMKPEPRLVKVIYDEKGHLITVVPLSSYAKTEKEEENTKYVTLQPIVVQRPTQVVEKKNVEILTLPTEIGQRIDSLSNSQDELAIKISDVSTRQEDLVTRMGTISFNQGELASKFDNISTKQDELALKVNAIVINQDELVTKIDPLYSKINSISDEQEELFARFNSISNRYETLVKELIEKTRRPTRIIKKVIVRRPRVIRRVVIKRVKKPEKGPSRARIIRVFRNVLKLRSFKKVLIVSDKTNASFGAILFDVARKINKKTVMMVMETRKKARQEPEEAVRRAMERADLILVATKYSVKGTKTVRRLLAQGKNFFGIQKSLKVTQFKR